MLEGLQHLIAFDRPIRDVLLDFLDILIVSFIVYRTLLVLKGTRAMQMGIGFVAFGLLYLLAKYAELATLMSVLSWLASSAILIFVVVFQNDIRRALIRLGAKAWLTRGHAAQERIIEEVVAAATELARHRMGALICFERDANIFEFVQNDGILLDSELNRELLVSLFIPEAVNKTHDGAVVIRNLRIARAGVFFPLPELAKIDDPTLGSRHRAAIGITEETDAVVVVVSEERGKITLFFGNHHVPNVAAANLKDALGGLLGGLPSSKKRRLSDRIRAAFRLGAKARDPEVKAASGSTTSTRRSDGSGPKTERVPKIAGDKAATAASGKHPAQSKAPVTTSEKKPQSMRPPPITKSGKPASPKKKDGPSKKDSPTKKSGRFTAMKTDKTPIRDTMTSSVPRAPDERETEKKPDSTAAPPKTPLPPQVSVPMPSAADKEAEKKTDEKKAGEKKADEKKAGEKKAGEKKAEGKAARTDGDAIPPPAESDPGPPPSVSKPMTPTDLPSSPGTVRLSGDDT